MPRPKGTPKTGGRQKGSPNRVTRAVKEFLTELVDDAKVQQAVRERVLAGETVGFFKALEMVHGKPRQSLHVNESDSWVIALPPGDDVSDE
jgi:hypothetical protein